MDSCCESCWSVTIGRGSPLYTVYPEWVGFIEVNTEQIDSALQLLMRQVGQMGIKRRKRETEITPQSHWNQGRRVNSVRKHGPGPFLSLPLVISTFTEHILIMTWDRYQLAIYLPVNVSYFSHKISLVIVQTAGLKLFNNVRVFSLLLAAPLHRKMKLLVLALGIALLFAAGQSATDSPLCKHNLSSWAPGTFCRTALAFAANVSFTERRSGLLCRCLYGLL